VVKEKSVQGTSGVAPDEGEGGTMENKKSKSTAGVEKWR